MKKIMSFICILCVTLSCVKKEQAPGAESQILTLLNQNSSDEALEKIEAELQKDPNNDELLYLKASALSMKAGIDIYALFPLLKVKIFDVAISQWSQNREFQKKNADQRIGAGVKFDPTKDPEDPTGYKPLEEKKLNYIFLFSYVLSKEENSCRAVITVKTKAFKDDDVYLNFDKMELKFCKIAESNVYNRITPELDKLIKDAISKVHYNRWVEHKKDVNRKQMNMNAIAKLWTLVDLIPLISKIPKISSSGFQSLTEAQEILVKLKLRHNKTEFGNKARKQLMMLSSLKIIGRLQNSVRLDLVNHPVDLVCLADESVINELLDSEQDSYYMLESIDDPEIIKKNQNVFNELKSMHAEIQKEINDPILKEKRIKRLVKSLKKSKKSNCSENGNEEDDEDEEDEDEFINKKAELRALNKNEVILEEEHEDKYINKKSEYRALNKTETIQEITSEEYVQEDEGEYINKKSELRALNKFEVIQEIKETKKTRNHSLDEARQLLLYPSP